MAASVAVHDARDLHRRGQLYVVLAACAWSTAGVLQRELSLDIPTQVAGRAFFATLALFAYVAFAERGHVRRSWRAIGLDGLGVAAGTAVASATFIVALNHATVAHVLFFQAAAPVLAALLGAAMLGESISARTWVAMAVAIGGVAVMIGGPGGSDALGNVLSIVMVFAFAASIVLTRRRREVSMAPAVCLSQVLVFAVTAPLAHPGAIDGRDLALLVALGAGQMGLGLGFVVAGARLVPAAELVLITLLEIVLGPLWVWIVQSEQPGTATLVGGVVVVAAVVIQVTGRETALRPTRSGGAGLPP
jgi:drug/metabolite transporter (DMT)-like permease